MDEQQESAVHDPQWYIAIQHAERGVEHPEWAQCCVTQRLGGTPRDIGEELLATHLDTDDTVYRVLIWSNPERTGVVWAVTRDSAVRFNPYTGERSELLPLPLPVAPQGNSPAEPAPERPDGAEQWREAQTATEAGLKWAEAAEKARNQPYPQADDARLNQAAAQRIRADYVAARDRAERETTDGPQRIPVDYEPAVVNTARMLNEAIQTVTDYVRTHRDTSDWATVEECLAPIATAASGFVTAYMMWRLSE